MGKGAVFSGILHLAVLLLAVFGLPWFYDTNEVLQATPVTVISEAQLAELQSKTPPAQPKKQEHPKAQEIPPAPKAPDVAAPEPEPEPPPPEPAPQPQPEAKAEQEQQPVVQPDPPQPEPQVVAPEPPPQPQPQPVPPPEPQVAEAQPKPVPPKKPKPPKKEEPKKPEKPKEDQVAADDTSFLKDIEKKLKKNQKKTTAQSAPEQQAERPQDNYDGPPLSEGEKDVIRQQIKQNWIIDIGMQGLEDMTVSVHVRMNPDGSVQSVTVDQGSSNGNPNWPIYAESCRRAVLKSNPLRMPQDKPYAAWATMTLDFSAREMLGY